MWQLGRFSKIRSLIYVHACTYMYSVCLCICMYAVCMYASMCVHACVCVNAYVCMHACTSLLVCVCVCVCVHMGTHARMCVGMTDNEKTWLPWTCTNIHFLLFEIIHIVSWKWIQLLSHYLPQFSCSYSTSWFACLIAYIMSILAKNLATFYYRYVIINDRRLNCNLLWC